VSERAPLVMVVDDFRDGRELVVELLGHAGLRTEQAGDGNEALEKALTLHPDLILLDLSLPGVDGWEITRRLKADPLTRAIHIVALTAHATRGPLDRAREVGCDLVLTKPCPPDQLVARVKRLLAGALEGGEPVA
jgi:CheY-like chemotaxis protein